ncbi:MAG: 3'-5' exonuclease, partial [Actinomycetota bacterium]
DRFPRARIVKLEDNYRSTPEVLVLANRLSDKLGGYDKKLRPTRSSGPQSTIRPVADEASEADLVVQEVRRLHGGERIPYEDMAVLYRINARSERFEEALADAGIPFQVRDGAFLRRPGPRAAFSRLRRETVGPVVDVVDRATTALGHDPNAEPDSEEEATRQSDLSRLRALGREFAHAHPTGSTTDFLEELTRRFSVERSGRGVNLMTYHRAKGLEFDAVFLPRLLDGELPFRSGRSRAPVDEERRLLYVGVTRAKRFVFVTWPADARAGRSPFVGELAGIAEAEGPMLTGSPRAAGTPKPPLPTNDPLFDALKRWRRERADRDGVPAYVVFHDATLVEIAARRPRSAADLRSISGIGPAKVERYGADVLTVLEES